MSAQDALLTIIEQLPSSRLLCVGDVMLDRFMYGHVDRISPEAPIPVFTMDKESRMLGGAGNVVRNLLSLDGEATFVSVIGDDSVGKQLTGLVGAEKRLVPYLITETGRVSTKKTRFVANGQQLLRSDHETKSMLQDSTAAQMLEIIVGEIPEHKAVILSDYGKGVLTASVVRATIDAAKAKNVPVFVDPKQRDVSIYAGATVLSPNLKELALTMGVDSFICEEAIIGAAQTLCNQHAFDYVLVTRGKDGMTLVNAKGLVKHIPANAREVFDVSGAGDTAIATLAAAYAVGNDMAHAAELANLAAGVVVGRLGTAVVYRSDLTTALYTNQALEHQQKILPLNYAQDMVTSWKRDKLKVGFTNGCFDIMHAGHVSLLQDAKARCDKLVIGLNTDASVKRLKGESRPVNHELDRATLLAALSMVDLVVLFDEDTPIKLLEALKPDALMKGADYTKEQVVGWEFVESYGGKVELLPLKQGYSTTDIIKKASSSAA
jgi:D-beta-D-heptose 7-phosphate kinase/D-beta-D-heptose 1-phosphate adenosyltransferase